MRSSPHRARRRSTTAAALGALALSLFAPAGLAQQALFEAPRFEKQVFDLDSVFIAPAELSAATDALSALASNFPGHEKVTQDLRARALGISLRLDGVHSASVDALEKLVAGEQTEPVPGFDDPAAAAAALWGVGEALDVPDATEHDQLLACFLMDIAARVDPEHPGGIERFQKLALECDFAGWGGVVVGTGGGGAVRPGGGGGTAVPENTFPSDDDPVVTPPVGPAVKLKKERGVYRMLTLDPGANPPAGRVAGLEAVSIIGTLEAPMTLRFADEDGGVIAGLEPTSAFIPVAMRATGAGWPANGGSVTITIEGGYATAAGQGAALPAALLLKSMIAGADLVDGVAPVGGLGEAGEVTAADDLLGHLRGLGAAAPLVIVPEANLPQLQDLAVMGQLDVLLKHQVFTVADFAGAEAVAIDQSDDLKRARLFFGEVQDLADTMPATALVTNGRVRARLERIIKLAPAHASSRVLLAAGGGDLPDKLSAAGSLHALELAVAPILPLMDGGGDPVAQNLPVLAAAASSLTKLRPKFDPGSLALADDLGTLFERIQAYSRLRDRDAGRGPAMKAEVMESWESVKSGYRALKSEGGGAN